MFDAVIVICSFGLDVAFFTSSFSNKGKEAAVLIILLRLWRIRRIIDSIVEVEKVKLSHVINDYQREKTLAENKSEVLILKVEDLEHEVAYLKEKLKKTERDSLMVRKHRKRDSGSSGSYRQTTVTIGIETSPASYPSVGTQTKEMLCEFCASSPGLHAFAEKLTACILSEVFSSVQIPPLKPSSPFHKFVGRGAKLKHRLEGASDLGTGRMWDISHGIVKSTDKQVSGFICSAIIDPKCTESSPESGYGSAGSSRHYASSASPYDSLSSADTSSSSCSVKHGRTVFLFPDPGSAHFSRSGSIDSRSGSVDQGVELDVLDEVSEIERIKNVEFDPECNGKDTPMTSL